MILNCPLLFSNLNRYVLLQGSQIDVDKAFHNITLTLACLNDNRMDRDPGMVTTAQMYLKANVTSPRAGV